MKRFCKVKIPCLFHKWVTIRKELGYYPDDKKNKIKEQESRGVGLVQECRVCGKSRRVEFLIDKSLEILKRS